MKTLEVFSIGLSAIGLIAHLWIGPEESTALIQLMAVHIGLRFTYDLIVLLPTFQPPSSLSLYAAGTMISIAEVINEIINANPLSAIYSVLIIIEAFLILIMLKKYLHP